MKVWSYGNGHHSREGEVKKSEIHEKEEPEKFDYSPLKCDHGVDQKGISYRLNKNIRTLNCHMHK